VTRLNIKWLSIAAIVIGLGLEVFRIGSQYSVGTLIAGVGVVVFVYDRMARPRS
jgi:hypothetical protein